MENTFEYLQTREGYSVEPLQNLIDSISLEDNADSVNYLLENTSTKEIPDMMQLMIETIKHLSK